MRWHVSVRTWDYARTVRDFPSIPTCWDFLSAENTSIVFFFFFSHPFTRKGAVFCSILFYLRHLRFIFEIRPSRKNENFSKPRESINGRDGGLSAKPTRTSAGKLATESLPPARRARCGLGGEVCYLARVVTELYSDWPGPGYRRSCYRVIK